MEVFLIVFAFVSSVNWIVLIANELVGVLSSYGILINVPVAVLGATILAWGDSLGDFVADIAVARDGYPEVCCNFEAQVVKGCFISLLSPVPSVNQRWQSRAPSLVRCLTFSWVLACR